MSNTFFTADLHFNHANIIKYCNRPYDSLTEMNEKLIENWNNKVKPKDTIYVLGDFIFKNKNFFITKLNGNKIILKGDHDNYASNKHLMNIKIDKQYITLCHWCLRIWAKSHYNSWHLYAHSHGNLQPIGKSWDVGVDNNNYEPLSFEEVKAIMDDRPDNPNLVKKDGKIFNR